VEVDDRSERVGRKIAEAQARKIPYMLVVGRREAEAGQVSVRNRAGDQTSETLQDFKTRLLTEISERNPSPLRGG
jgi:threonyl-tRNA synthetase